MNKKVLCFVLLILSVSLLFTSCAEKTKTGDNTTEASEALSQNGAETPASESVSAESESVTYPQPDFAYFKTEEEVLASFPKTTSARVEEAEPVSGESKVRYYNGDQLTEERTYIEDGKLQGAVFYDAAGKATFKYSYEYFDDGFVLDFVHFKDEKITDDWGYSFFPDGRTNGVKRVLYDADGNMTDACFYEFNEAGEVINYENTETLQQYIVNALSDRLGQALTPEAILGALGGELK